MRRTTDIRVVALGPGDVRFTVSDVDVKPSVMQRLRPYLRRVGVDDSGSALSVGSVEAIPPRR